MKIVPPGDDVCPTPAPIDEDPPNDRFCDLVLTGGVASGVVYPWAIVELARAYRFRNIGGTSVGAMAAALAAAAEYGRRTGFETPFETLRRLPAALGEMLPDGRTRMLSLFQTVPRGRRLIDLWARLGKGSPLDPEQKAPSGRALCEVAKAYAAPLWLGALLGLWLVLAFSTPLVHLVGWREWFPVLLAMTLTTGLGALLGLGLAMWGDIKIGVIGNELGLCKGGTLDASSPDDPRPGLSEWLHQGIQRSAGLALTDPPLTFRDLWSAPAYPGAAPRRCADTDPPRQRAINLQMITTNVTHGRPYRLPLADETSRLFYKRDDLKDYLPPAVLDALAKASRPYVSSASADPEPGERTKGFLELPGADMPVVVAARLSLSFPLLFSAVPLYAIDYETPRRAERALKRCLFTDGGVSSNFPIHLFDAALPRWPTFGLWLDRQDPYASVRDKPEDVWLPEFHRQGWGDNWDRFDPQAAATPEGKAQALRPAAGSVEPPPAPKLGLLLGFLRGMASNALDWRDRTSFRLPHVRNRVARLLLRPGEGGLNIGMPREQILQMAHRYGTAAGKLFVARFADRGGAESEAWREQRWVRLQLLISGLRERLNGFSSAAAFAAHGLPMREEIEQTTGKAPLRDHGRSPTLKAEQAQSLIELITDLEHLEMRLTDAVPQDYKPTPEPELRLRAPL